MKKRYFIDETRVFLAPSFFNLTGAGMRLTQKIKDLWE